MWRWSWLNLSWTTPLSWWQAWDACAIPVGGSNWRRTGCDAPAGTPTTWVESNADDPASILASVEHQASRLLPARGTAQCCCAPATSSRSMPTDHTHQAGREPCARVRGDLGSATRPGATAAERDRGHRRAGPLIAEQEHPDRDIRCLAYSFHRHAVDQALVNREINVPRRVRGGGHGDRVPEQIRPGPAEQQTGHEARDERARRSRRGRAAGFQAGSEALHRPAFATNTRLATCVDRHRRHPEPPSSASPPSR